MAGQFQICSVLLVLALSNAALSFPSDIVIKDGGKNEDGVVSANVDIFFDALLPLLRKSIIENGMEPMKLTDFSEPVLPLPGKLQGSVDLTNGWLQEMSNLKRAKHVVATYANKTLHLDMDLGWSVLDFNYTYLFKYLMVRRTGDVYGRFKKTEVRVAMTVDMDEYQVSLDSIKFTKVGKFNLKFEGHVLDPLVNVGAKAITTMFRQHVLSNMEKRGLFIFREAVKDLNERLAEHRPKRGEQKELQIEFA